MQDEYRGEFESSECRGLVLSIAALSMIFFYVSNFKEMDSSFPFSNLFQSSELKVVEYRFYQAMGSSLQLEPQLNGSREEMSLGQCAWKR